MKLLTIIIVGICLALGARILADPASPCYGKADEPPAPSCWEISCSTNPRNPAEPLQPCTEGTIDPCGSICGTSAQETGQLHDNGYEVRPAILTYKTGVAVLSESGSCSCTQLSEEEDQAPREKSFCKLTQQGCSNPFE